MPTWATALAVCIVICGDVQPVRADGGVVITVREPTGPVGSVHLRGTHRGAFAWGGSLWLSNFAEVSWERDRMMSACDPCDGVDANATSIKRQRVGFRLAHPAGTWHPAVPALSLEVRVTTGAEPSPFARLREVEVLALAQRQVGPVDLVAGVTGLTAETKRTDEAGGAIARLTEAPLVVRPVLAATWTPAIWPRTRVLGELAWQTQLTPDAPRARWLAGWGVRYWATPNLAAELAVQHRQGDGLPESTVLIGVRAAVWNR